MADEKRGEDPLNEERMEEEKNNTENDEESEEDESDDEEYFEVERIISRKKQNGIFVYRVRWKGYSPSNDTWEPAANLEVVEDMVVEFDKKEEEKAKARQEERRLRKLRMEGKKLPGEGSSSSSESSDDDKLLSEDVRFFKQLEKNKFLALDGTDLYSKVKSRTAILASKKKKGGESNNTSSVSTPRSAKKKEKEEKTESGSDAKTERSDSTKSQSRGRPKGSFKKVKDAGKGRGRPKKRSSLSLTDSSDDDSDASSLNSSRPSQKAGGRGRPTKRHVSESSDDSDDSAPLSKSKLNESRSKRGRGRPKKSIISDSDQDGKSATDPVKADTKTDIGGDKPTKEEKRLEKPPKKKKVRQILSDSDSEQQSDASSKPEKTLPVAVLTSAVSEVTAPSDKVIKVEKKVKLEKKDDKTDKKDDKSDKKDDKPDKKDDKLDKKDDKADKKDDKSDKKDDKLDKKDDKSDKKDDKTDKKDDLKKSDDVKKSEPSIPKVRTPKPDAAPIKPAAHKMQSHEMMIPVLEKFAFQVGTIHTETDDKITKEKIVMPAPEGEPAVLVAEAPKEAVSSDTESMETEVFEKKQLKGPKKEKEREKEKKSRKRKPDTEAEHLKAVNEGAASPLKAMSPSQPTSPADTGQAAGTDVNPPTPAGQKSVHSDSEPEEYPTSATASPSVVKKSDKKALLKCGIKVKDSSKLKPESPKAQRHSPLFLVDTVKREELKMKGEASRSASRTSVKEARSTSPSGSSRKDKASASSKSDLATKSTRPEADSKYLKPESASSRLAKPEVADRSSVGVDSVDARKKFGLVTTTAASSVDPSKESVYSASISSISSVSLSAGLLSAGSSLSGLPSSVNKDSTSTTSSLFSSSYTATTSRDTSTSSLYPGYRDYTSSRASLGLSQFSTTPSRDSSVPLGLGRDITLPSGYTHLTSSSTSSSPITRDFSSYSPRGGLDTRTLGAGSSRLGLPASLSSISSISGKENADRPFGMKSTSTSKMGSSVQPLDTIFNSSLYAAEAKQNKVNESDFDSILVPTSLEDLERLLLPPVTPMELNDQELRQAVVDGNYYCVRRALAAAKKYDLNLPDNKGYTLLMNAVLKGYDDIIMQLLLNGADSEVQVNGVTSLMLAVEHAECSTVYMLLEMGAHVNTRDLNGETSLFKAVMRGDKQILYKVLEHGANFALKSNTTGLNALEVAKHHRLADVEITLTDHIQRVVHAFEEQVNLTIRGTARLVERLFPHYCVPLYESDTITIPFKHQPALPSAPGMGCLLFIAHSRFTQQEVKCRLYGQCAVVKVTLNGVEQLCLTEESNFVLMCHPLIAGYNELVIHTKKDVISRAKLIICAYKAQLIYR